MLQNRLRKQEDICLSVKCYAVEVKSHLKGFGLVFCDLRFIYLILFPAIFISRWNKQEDFRVFKKKYILFSLFQFLLVSLIKEISTRNEIYFFSAASSLTLLNKKRNWIHKWDRQYPQHNPVGSVLPWVTGKSYRL